METIDLAHSIVDALSNKKGSDILLLDIREQSILADYFLLCSAENTPQLKAIVNEVTQTTKEIAGIQPQGLEGEAENGWMLIDYENIIIHLFHPDVRQYYNLEELYRQAHIVIRMP